MRERGEGGESHTTYAYKYISECIFLNFESVLNYTRTLAHTQRRCTLPLPLPLPRPRLCWRVETRISSMFNPKHKTEKPNRQKHNQIEPKPRQASTRCAPSRSLPSPALLHLHLRHNLVLVLVLALGRGLKYFTGNLRKRNPSNNMFYTFL